MRWLLLKDLQILKRSPLVVALLVAYPIIIGILIGFALSGDEGKPRVAFLNEVEGEESFSLGSDEGEFGAEQARGRAVRAGRVRRRLVARRGRGDGSRRRGARAR